MSFYYSFIAGPTVRSKAVEMEVITSVVTDKDTGIRVDIYVARAESQLPRGGRRRNRH